MLEKLRKLVLDYADKILPDMIDKINDYIEKINDHDIIIAGR